MVFFSWLGPEEIFTAAGVDPQTNIEYCGFNQFTISGIHSNSNIIHSHLRLTVNSHSGTLPLELNINHITNTNIPSSQECLSPPYYLQGEEVNVSTGGTIWFDLSNTNAPTHIMEANNGNHMFGIGLSDNDTYTKSHYKFYGYSEDLVVDTKLKVFVDDGNIKFTGSLLEIAEVNQTIVEPSLLVKRNLIKQGVEIEFSSGNNEEAWLRIYDVGGRLIRTWISSGTNNVNRIYWDCRDNFGCICPKGIYFVRLSTFSYTITEKLEIIE